jgi:hypothetical protein
MAKFKKDKLTEAISAVIHDNLKSAPIISVKVEPGENADGESILRVRVVYGGKRGLDPDETVSMIRHVRRRLFEMDEERFPHISYISEKDARDLAAA